MTFTFRKGVRENAGLLIGLIGSSGSGKTFSALRLASGLSQGKPFAIIDTEAGRALHYADQFNFDHGDLKPPFRPDAYIEAIMAADKAGYPVIVVDSTSLVWSGDGGVLDWQEEELQRMSGGDWQKAERVKMASWIKPKMAHKKMVQQLLQVRAHLILCFRAEEKIEMVKVDGKMQIIPKTSMTGLNGWIPVCDKSLPYELTVSFLMTADAPGVPKPIKLQEQHKKLFDLNSPLTEESGKLIGIWASGSAEKPIDYTDEIRNLLFDADIPEADFLEKAKISSMSDLINIDGAKAWIKKNNRFGSARNAASPSINAASPSIIEQFAPQTVVPSMTYALVAEKIAKSDAMDVLELAGDFINMVVNEDQRGELRELYATRELAIKAAGK